MFREAEQDEALLGEEYDGPVLKSSARRSKHQLNFKRSFYFLIALNLLALVLVGTGTLPLVTNLSAALHEQKNLFPSISLHQQMFEPNNSFYKVFNADQKAVWDGLMPPAGGFIRIENPQRYGLSGGYPLENTGGVEAESYCLSVFHQLHCLDSIRTHIEHLSQPEGRLEERKLSHPPPELHVSHCLDYLRQAIMCFGDMSLEKATVDQDGNVVHSTNGWGGNHTCKAWNEVIDITESMDVYNKKNVE